MTQQNPHTHASSKNWSINRRNFLKTTLAASLASSIPFWMACGSEKSAFELNIKQKRITEIVQEFLFPKDGNGPSASDVQAHQYFQWVLIEEGTDKEDKEYLINGIEWIDETAVEEKERSFLKLTAEEQDNLLEYITTKDWGESWLSMMLTIIFEALFCDPIYGGNTDQEGWKWLEHNPGQPRPSEDLKLGNFMNHIKQNS